MDSAGARAGRFPGPATPSTTTHLLPMSIHSFHATPDASRWERALIFLGTGGTLIGIGLWEGWPMLFPAILAAPLVLIGVALVGLRVRFDFDPHHRRMVKSVRVFGVGSRREIDCSGFTGLKLELRRVPTGHRAQYEEHFPISLVGEGAEEEIHVAASYRKARARARQLRRLFNLPVFDRVESSES